MQFETSTVISVGGTSRGVSPVRLIRETLHTGGAPYRGCDILNGKTYAVPDSCSHKESTFSGEFGVKSM